MKPTVSYFSHVWAMWYDEAVSHTQKTSKLKDITPNL